MYKRISLSRIGTRDPHFEPSLALMEASFPADERREEDDLRALIEGNPLFAFNVVKSDGERVGLMTTWNFGKFIYVEHFATEPSVRGGGMGAASLRELASMADLPIVLEVEPPAQSDEARRRVGFYERSGFKLWRTPYTQPPYSKEKRSLPMSLMAYGLEETPDCAKIVTALLYRHVYKAKLPACGI